MSSTQGLRAGIILADIGFLKRGERLVIRVHRMHGKNKSARSRDGNGAGKAETRQALLVSSGAPWQPIWLFPIWCCDQMGMEDWTLGTGTAQLSYSSLSTRSIPLSQLYLRMAIR